MRLIGSIVTAAFALTAPVSAATVLAYQSASGPSGLSASITGEGVTGHTLERGSMLVEEHSLTFNSKNWSTALDKDAAFAAGSSLSWGFTSEVGYDLTTIDLGYDRSHKGPGFLALDAVIDGVWHENLFVDSDISTIGEVNTGIDLSAFQNVRSATFYLVGWRASKSKGTFDLENVLGGGHSIVLSGEASALNPDQSAEEATAVTVVPLPAGFPLLASVLALLVLIRRSRA